MCIALTYLLCKLFMNNIMGSPFLLKEDIFKNSKLKHSPKVTTYIYFNEMKAFRNLKWFELNSKYCTLVIIQDFPAILIHTCSRITLNGLWKILKVCSN